ncbi:hypothetical protein CGCS363_v014808 [Colletotrichum siamense]|uniref:uncharacterized protein n=1 Tax=Colletotrichum siamense TaxID=690259 RepID=UPI00187281C7|nr:uncharacterized protein CGCS363_v014808 [Colletotrichum siamense]KAF5484357.1 hypothetical protein CGCS363_v014808 [Colletotrichum siamense]
MSTADHVRIGRAFTGLFSALSAWQPSDNLVLDISIHSPSDSDHWFKYLTFVPDMAPENCNWKKRLPKPIQVNFDDKKHGWIAGHRVSPPHPVLIEDMFGAIVWNGIPRAYQLKSQEAESMTKIDSRPSETEYPQQWQWLEKIVELQEAEYKGNLWLEASRNKDSPETYKRDEKWFKRHMKKRAVETDKQKKVWWESLPTVTAVTGVILRQQNRRQLTEILGKILFRFPGLQEIHYEPWRREWKFDQEEADRKLLGPQLGVQPIQMPTPKVGKAIAHVSLQLEHLSASFTVDASHFFSSCEPSWKWSNLTSLALTSRLLAPDATTTQIGAMLRTAAKVALRMPKLRVMEVWNGQEGLAALFKYKSMGHGQRPVITWRATWDYALQPSVIQTWRAVSIEHQGEHYWNDCVVVKELLNVGDVRCHGDAIHHLKLSSSVIRPVSLHQIRTESRVLDGTYEWSL